MGRWVKEGRATVERRVAVGQWVCEFGGVHNVAVPCGCIEETVTKGVGFISVHNGRKRPTRVSDGKGSYAFSMDRKTAKALGFNPPPRRRGKPKDPALPMWEMTKEQRARAAQRNANL